MENKKDEDIRKRRKVMIVLFVMILLMVIGTSFALWQLTFRQTGTNVVTSGCFKVEYTNESDAVTINDAYPTVDSEGKNLAPYKFTITNKCDSAASYYINLETISSGDKLLDEEYLKANLTTSDEEFFLDNLKDEYINQEKFLDESSVAYKLAEGTLSGNESKTYDLRLWLDSETPLIDKVMNATYQGKITVLATNLSLAKTMIAMDTIINGDRIINNTYTQNGKYKLSKISFEDKITNLENVTETIDFSQDKNRKVLGHYVKDSNTDTYTLHIQANGKIEANENATAYFAYTPVINETVVFDGIENVDTKNVTNMSYMFYKYSGTTLDLSSLDTSNVTDMSSMFSSCNLLTELNLDNFATSKVTTMNYMFYNCSSLINLDTSSFNTINVRNMISMFYGCGSLTTLDLSNFDTSKVTTMRMMFYNCRSLTTLDLSSLDTSNITDTSFMFENCYKIVATITIREPINEGGIITMGYSYMFYNAATEEGAQIIVNYTTRRSDVVDEMLKTKSKNSNVVKGVLVS